jgi:hypothetical protein
MLSVRSFAALCLITLCVVIAAVVASGDSEAIPGSGEPLFPELMSRLNDIQEIRLGSGSGQFVLERSDGGWTSPEKSGYPADADKVHKLLIGAAGLKRVEPKTADPARYAKLGLGDETSTSMSYQLKTENDTTVAELDVGHSAPAKGDPDLSELYVRASDNPRVWLVEGKLPRGDALVDWLQRTVIGVDRARVRQTQVVHASGELVSVTRELGTKNDFRLMDAPPSKTVDGQWKLNDIGRLFSDLELEDVLPKDEASIEGEPDHVVTMRTFDGLVVRMDVFKREQRPFGVLKAEFDPQGTETNGTPEQNAALLSAEEVRAETDRLNARWARWAYVLPGFKLDALARSHDELLKDLEEDKKPNQG